MADDPVRLVTSPSVSDQAKQDAVEILRKWLARAEAGEVQELLVCGTRPDKSWFNEYTRMLHAPAFVGRLHMTTHRIVANFFEDYPESR